MFPKDVFFPKDENNKLAKEIPHGITVVTDATLDLAKESSALSKIVGDEQRCFKV